MPEPLYTSVNCKQAYELRWSLALFATCDLASSDNWLPDLKKVVEVDGVRILEYQASHPPILHFLLSTKPTISSPQIVKSVKGRLQHLIRSSYPGAFRRNFSLSSVGEVRQEEIENYVASQLGHHRMADERVQERLAAFQLEFPEVDLAEPFFSSHARYVYNLHLVLVHNGRWCEVREDRLMRTREMILGIAKKKKHRLSRAAILSDHVHLTMGCAIEETPEAVALTYMNNLAYAHGMEPLFYHSYYVGTFGTYDLGAIRRLL
jgi:REP element-mobilizing transposase RayT